MIPFIYTQHFCLGIFCCGLQAATSEVETLLHVPAETWGTMGNNSHRADPEAQGDKVARNGFPQVSTLAIMLHLPLRKEIGIQGNLFSFGPLEPCLSCEKTSRILYCLSVALH